MDTARTRVILSRLVAELTQRDSWCGETHVQKATYLVQELVDVRTGFEFVLYKHGPFSFDLRGELNGMLADGVLELQHRDPRYGPALVRTNVTENLEARFAPTVAHYSQAIAFVAEAVRDAGVTELERLATALYVLRSHPVADDEAIAVELHDLKPHISLDPARGAVAEIRRLDNDASKYRLALGNIS